MSTNPAFAVDGLDLRVSVKHVAGVEGPSIYVNHRRVAGPKPWGGGELVHEWHTTIRELLIGILGDPEVGDEELTRLARKDALGFHRELRRRQSPALLHRLSEMAAITVAPPAGGVPVGPAPLHSPFCAYPNGKDYCDCALRQGAPDD